MDSSRRAVESYWRSRMVDGATANEDKVAPVYKLEEICELLRSSHVSIVKEVSEFVLKRLDHKSPIVKQKALRLIKYCVGKSGSEFQREMQRHSVAVRQLVHYRGQPDPLKGDALNKAVRDSAQEAIAAIFSEQNNTKSEPVGNVSRRIEGFGNTNFHLPTEDKKSFLSEVVGIGSASIKQGLSSFTQGHSFKNSNDNGSYKGPNLQRSLTVEKDYSDRYVPAEIPRENQGSFGASKSAAAGPWNSEARAVQMEASNGESSSTYSENKTREERLLETIVTSGGVRLQPTRDAIQVFLMEAAKLDALALSRALESKLQFPQWQVRMKAVCVLDAIIRKKDDEPFSIVASYFGENNDCLIRCSESPQASLRERANKVLSLLGGEQASTIGGNSVKPLKAEKEFVEMPNLIDTGDSSSDNFFGTDDSTSTDQNAGNPITHTPPLIDDLFGGSVDYNVGPNQPGNDDDPFADVSFHNEGKDHTGDIFTGMAVSKTQSATGDRVAANSNGTELFDVFQSSPEVSSGQEVGANNVSDLIAGLSINENASKTNNQNGASVLEKYPANQVSGDPLSNLLGSQAMGIGANATFGNSSMPNGLPPGMMLNPAFVPQPLNYGQMGNFFNQQQLLATMAHLQNLGNLSGQNLGSGQALGSLGGYPSPFPDVFQSNFPNEAPISTMNNLKKEENTKAFDFISDHLAAARDPKKVL